MKERGRGVLEGDTPQGFVRIWEEGKTKKKGGRCEGRMRERGWQGRDGGKNPFEGRVFLWVGVRGVFFVKRGGHFSKCTTVMYSTLQVKLLVTLHVKNRYK